jgi:hypothetical protein
MVKNNSIPVIELDDSIPLIEGGSARFEKQDVGKSDLEVEFGEMVELELTTEIIKLDDSKHHVWGWASVIESPTGTTVVDHQGDTISSEELKSMAWNYLNSCRDAGEMHIRKGVGHLVDSIVFTKELQGALGIDLGKVGWFVGFEITDPKVWKRVKEGELRSLSVHGKGIRNELS